jgi:hypothetical protein
MVNLPPWISRLIGGYPMLCEDYAFTRGDGERVCYFIDARGRRWFATGAWDRNRVLWDDYAITAEKKQSYKLYDL